VPTPTPIGAAIVGVEEADGEFWACVPTLEPLKLLGMQLNGCRLAFLRPHLAVVSLRNGALIVRGACRQGGCLSLAPLWSRLGPSPFHPMRMPWVSLHPSQITIAAAAAATGSARAREARHYTRQERRAEEGRRFNQIQGCTDGCGGQS